MRRFHRIVAAATAAGVLLTAGCTGGSHRTPPSPTLSYFRGPSQFLLTQSIRQAGRLATFVSPASPCVDTGSVIITGVTVTRTLGPIRLTNWSLSPENGVFHLGDIPHRAGFSRRHPITAPCRQAGARYPREHLWVTFTSTNTTAARAIGLTITYVSAGAARTTTFDTGFGLCIPTTGTTAVCPKAWSADPFADGTDSPHPTRTH